MFGLGNFSCLLLLLMFVVFVAQTYVRFWFKIFGAMDFAALCDWSFAIVCTLFFLWEILKFTYKYLSSISFQLSCAHNSHWFVWTHLFAYSP